MQNELVYRAFYSRGQQLCKCINKRKRLHFKSSTSTARIGLETSTRPSIVLGNNMVDLKSYEKVYITELWWNDT